MLGMNAAVSEKSEIAVSLKKTKYKDLFLIHINSCK